MASASPWERRADEIIKCPICLEDFISPRHVPGCLHSFCLRCIQGHCRDKRPGDWARCPLCRGNIIIPRNGLDGLRLNLVLQDLIDAKHASAVTAGTQGAYFKFSNSVFIWASGTAYFLFDPPVGSYSFGSATPHVSFGELTALPQTL